MIFMHHPPFEVGVPELDRINCLGGAEMGAIVARHPNVERVLCGHHHRPVQLRWCGTVGSVAPSTAYQSAFDLRPARLRFRLEPPGFMGLNYGRGTPLTLLAAQTVYGATLGFFAELAARA